MIASVSIASNKVIDLTASPSLSPEQHLKKRSADDIAQEPRKKKPKSTVLTFEEACENHNIYVPTLGESKQAIKPKVEQLKASLPGGIAALQQIMKEMQDVVAKIRNSQFEKAAELASYFVAMQVLELDMAETLRLVSNENYQNLSEHDFTMLCVVIIASIDIKEKLIKLSAYLHNNQVTAFINCDDILRTAQQVHLATADIQESVSKLPKAPHDEQAETYDD